MKFYLYFSVWLSLLWLGEARSGAARHLHDCSRNCQLHHSAYQRIWNRQWSKILSASSSPHYIIIIKYSSTFKVNSKTIRNNILYLKINNIEFFSTTCVCNNNYLRNNSIKLISIYIFFLSMWALRNIDSRYLNIFRFHH